MRIYISVYKIYCKFRQNFKINARAVGTHEISINQRQNTSEKHKTHKGSNTAQRKMLCLEQAIKSDCVTKYTELGRSNKIPLNFS